MQQLILVLLSLIMIQCLLPIRMNTWNSNEMKVFLKKFEPAMNRKLHYHKYYYRIGNLTSSKVFNKNSIEIIRAEFNFHTTTCKWKRRSYQAKNPFCELMPKYRTCQVYIHKYRKHTFKLNTIQCSKIKGKLNFD